MSYTNGSELLISILPGLLKIGVCLKRKLLQELIAVLAVLTLIHEFNEPSNVLLIE